MIYSGVCTGTIVTAAGMVEFGTGTKSDMDTRSDLDTEVDMSTGLIRAVGRGMGMLGLLL
jgi:hypothetical protein